MNVNETSAVLKLPRMLDFGAAEGFLETMRTRLQDNPQLRVDASAVEVLTVPCIQIILSALATYDEMSIERPSEEYINAFQDLGIDCSERHAGGTAVETSQDVSADVVSDSPLQTEESPMSKRILTIDDSKTIRDMLMLTLAEAGFEVLQAVDGQDGLDVLDKEQVDVVITDINMPRMDGYEVIRHLRNTQIDADPGPDHRKRNRQEESCPCGRRYRMDGQALRSGTVDRDHQQGRSISATIPSRSAADGKFGSTQGHVL